MTPIKKYIDTVHNGSKSAFAKELKRPIDPANVGRLLTAKKPFYVTDGKLVQVCNEIKTKGNKS